MIQGTFADIDDEYRRFVEKFKPKKTTDDCYTPDNIYQCVLSWAANKYGFDPSCAVRPFWPGMEYDAFPYQDGCVVVDNPPFSILTRIVRFYNANNINFVLFKPGLVMTPAANEIVVDISITYENGAKVPTSFCTNMGEYKLETDPELSEALQQIDRRNVKMQKKTVKKIVIPQGVLTMGKARYLVAHGQKIALRGRNVRLVKKCSGYALYGGGYIVSERAAAERAAAERAAAERIPLGEKEKAIQIELNKEEHEKCWINGGE